MSREVAMDVLAHLAEDPSDTRSAAYAEPAPLRSSEAAEPSRTAREVEVLSHVAVGMSNREIARELHLSLSTVKTHLEHAFTKLEVSDRTQAAWRAAEWNLLPEQITANRSIELT